MVSVGLFEPSWHPQLLAPLTQISVEAGWEVTLFTTHQNWKQVSNSPRLPESGSVSRQISLPSESRSEYTDRIEVESSKLDFIWTITPFGHPRTRKALFDFNPQCPSVSFIHSGSRYTNQKTTALATMFLRYSRILPYTLQEPVWTHIASRLAASHWIEPYDKVMSLYPSAASFLDEKISKPVGWFLPEFYRPMEFPETSKLRIVVPGTISSRRRDYDFVFDVIESLPTTKVKLELLGAPGSDSESILSRARNLIEQGYEILKPTEWVGPELFHESLTQADVILSPVRVTHYHGGGKERLGKTKTTGNIGDAVRSGTPIFMPSEFPVKQPFDGLIYSYQNIGDVVSIFKSIMHGEQKYDSNAVKTASKFNIQQQSDRISDIYKSVINS